MSNGIVSFSQLGKLGRFGNQIFQVAGTIGIARRNGFDFKFPLWINHDHKERFGSTEDVDIYKHLVNELPLYTGEPYPQRWVNWGYEDVNLYGNTDILGHLQSEKYFCHAIDEVRHCLTFKDEPEPMQLIALHWRAGDYQAGGKNVYHPRMEADYYEKAIIALKNEGIVLPIVPISDDIETALEFLNPILERHGFDTSHAHESLIIDSSYIEDFVYMKQCHSFICANSSFSLAAAILSNQPGKKIVCPAMWFGDPAGGLKMDYPQNAIVI